MIEEAFTTLSTARGPQSLAAGLALVVAALVVGWITTRAVRSVR